jgi:hypothetical protein
MAVFTIAASYIVTAAIGITGAAVLGAAGVAFVTSVVAVGLALATSRLLGLTGGAGGTAQDPGVRIQFPPATNNKIPIVYGTVNTKGVVTDARISNGNQTMTYVLAISEKTQTGTFSIGDIYWNDQKLVFKEDIPGYDDPELGSQPPQYRSHIVASSIDQNGLGQSDTNFDGLIRVRVYSGDTNSGSQIFPPQSTGNIENAKTVLGETDINYMLNGLVFAVIQIDYSGEKGITGLGQITFQLSNTLNNPALVWYDYMTSERYGAAIPTDQINTTTSISSANPLSVFNFSNQIPPNQFQGDGVTTSTQARYVINGVVSTGDTVKNSIEKISQGCAAWTTFDYSEGKWKLLNNRAASEGELNTAFEFNDDNILGEVGITATNLEDLYNQLEVEFASRKIRDQNDYFKGAIDESLMNDLEPPNTLSMRLEMVNNALHAARIGLIELKQSRVDKIITFRADYSAIQCEAGDVVKVTNSVYGFNDKLFRVTKLREIEGEEGSITVEVTALEYDSTIYADETLVDSPDTPGSGIPIFGGSSSLPPPSAPIPAIISTTTPSFSISTTVNAGSTAPDEIQWWYSTTSTGNFSYLTNEYAAAGTFNPGSVVNDILTIQQSGTYYFKARTGLGGRYSDFSTASSPGFVWNPNVGFDGGVI